MDSDELVPMVFALPPFPIAMTVGPGGAAPDVDGTAAGGVVPTTTNGLTICVRLGIGCGQVDHLRDHQRSDRDAVQCCKVTGHR